MSPWFWILVGVVLAPILVALTLAAIFIFWCLGAWANWKVKEINCRREWTQENPYWREAFEDGVKWVKEQQAQPITTEEKK